MSTYNFSLREGFLTPEVVTAINIEIDEVITGRTSSVIEGDSLTVTFSHTPPESDCVILYNIVNSADSYIPPVITSAYVNSGDSIIRHRINGVEHTYIGSQSNEIHISKESQGHFSSIKAAVAANPGQNKVFIIHPGDYIEDNPIIFEAGTVLTSCGNAENTFITAANPDDPILYYNIKCKLLGVTLRGASVGLHFNQAASGGMGKYSAIMECFIVNCIVGILCDGFNVHSAGGMADTLYAREIVINSTIRTLDKGVHVVRGGQFISSGVTVFGVPPIGPAAAVPITYGYYCEGAVSKIAMAITNCYFCGVGLYLDAGCSSEMSLLTLKYNANGVVIGAGSGPTRFSVNSLEIFGSITQDLTILNPGSLIEVHSGVFDDTKILNPAGVRLNMRYHTNKNGKTRQRMLGIINVGTPTEPAKMMIGEGSYDVYSLSVQRCTDGEGGTWSDVTADALEDSGVPFGIFAGTDAGNCLYVGRDKVPVGMKVSILTASSGALQGDIIWEYWDGSTWVEFHVMCTATAEPFYYVTSAFMASVGSYHVRFGLKSNAPLVAKSLNGVTKKWIRARVINALSSVPMSEYILAHTNATKIGSDGFTEYYGDARNVKKLTWNIYDMCDGGQDQIVYFGKKLYSGGTGNLLPTAVDCTMSLSAFVPTDLDNSFPLKIVLSVVCDVTGTIVITFRCNFSNGGSSLYLDKVSAPSITPGELSVTVTKSVVAGNETRLEAAMPVFGVNMNPSGQGPQSLWFSIEHAASDPYAGSIVLTQIGAYYVSWIDGAHLLAF